MRYAHFHLHSRAVYRSSGHSAVAASAYQANETLTGEKKKSGSVSIDHRKELNKGRITAGLWSEMQAMGITLSDAAVATKDGRRDWTITDGDAEYAIREYRQTTVNKETGKQETIHQALDVYASRTYDYSHKGDMVDKWMQAPESAPTWVQKAVAAQDRQGFWNAAEEAEHNRNGRPARTIEMALSRDLSLEDNKALVQAFVNEQLTSKGLVADIAIHSKPASDGRKNVHAHILFTTREIDGNGDFTETKDDYWNSKERIEGFRREWAATLNRAFEEKGLDVRVDHRSFKRRNVNKQPGEHLGPAATHMEQRGDETRKGDKNRRKDLLNAVQEALNPPDDPAPTPAPAPEPASLPAEAEPLRSEVQGYYQRSGGRFAAVSAEMANRLRAFGRALMRQAYALARDESSSGPSLLDKYAPPPASWRERIRQERQERQQRLEKERTHERER